MNEGEIADQGRRFERDRRAGVHLVVEALAERVLGKFHGADSK